MTLSLNCLWLRYMLIYLCLLKAYYMPKNITAINLTLEEENKPTERIIALELTFY